MKRIVLVRHAKSVPYGYENDYERDLQARGREDALLVSSDVEKREVFPDAIVSSPAKRALETALIYANALGYDTGKIRTDQTIYDGLTTAEFLEIIHSLPNEVNTVFFFGHNPDIHYFVHNLLSSYDWDMPTCATVAIDFPVNGWKEVQPRSGTMAFRLIPKMLR